MKANYKKFWIEQSNELWVHDYLNPNTYFMNYHMYRSSISKAIEVYFNTITIKHCVHASSYECKNEFLAYTCNKASNASIICILPVLVSRMWPVRCSAIDLWSKLYIAKYKQFTGSILIGFSCLVLAHYRKPKST